MENQNKESGYTLVELIVVLAIIGILAAVTVPGLSRPKREANLAATQMAGHCLESALALFDAHSADPLRRLPIGIASTQDLYDEAEKLGCSLGPTANLPQRKPQATLQNCRIWISDAGGPAQVYACASSEVTNLPVTATAEYEIRLFVPNQQTTVSFGSWHPLITY